MKIIKMYIPLLLLLFIVAGCNKNDNKVANPPVENPKVVDSSTMPIPEGYLQEGTDDVKHFESVEYEVITDSTDTTGSVDVACSEGYYLDKQAGSQAKDKTPSGKRINISVVGKDGRMGRGNIGHADANHVISILPEEGKIEIFSIPRDTYVNLNEDTASGMNKLTICYYTRGRQRYHKEICRITKLQKIDHYVEFGFSQAMGIIEFLGYKEPAKTLQVLRSRKALGGDDYQRCYTQGQFIRQAILKYFSKFTGTFGHLLARAGLMFVDTDMSADDVINLIDKLEAVNFPKNTDMVQVFVRPPVNIRYKVYDFGNDSTINALSKKINNANQYQYSNGTDAAQPVVNVQRRLEGIISSAIADSAKYPSRVISKMKPYFDQRAWMQIKDTNTRIRIRDQFGVLLSNAYRKKKQEADADRVINIIEAEKKLFGK